MNASSPSITDIENVFKAIQNHISDWLVKQCPSQNYREDRWDYAPKGKGGGITRVWEYDEMLRPSTSESDILLEKGGVNFSSVEGQRLPRAALAQMSGLIPKNEREPDSVPFHATGVSLVLHPLNPHIPTIHMNLRYFEVQSPLLPLSSAAVTSLWWFGGGIDLTPYYPDVYQVIQFHRHLADICERHGQPYAEYKEHCDSYFYLKHRHEMRGVGGIFFDHLTEKVSTKSALLNFVRDVGFSFTELYAPFLVHRMKSYTVAQRDFQLHRRSRYVEFNLLWDRGTKFGIESEGRTESILMSLPTVAKWTYNWHPAPDSVEAHISEFFFQPGKDWLHLDPTPYLKSIEQLAQ